MSSNYHLGSPLSGIKILDVGCGGGLLSEVRNRALCFSCFSNPQRRGFLFHGSLVAKCSEVFYKQHGLLSSLQKLGNEK